MNGLRHYLKLILRLERVKLPVWIIGIGAFYLISTLSVVSIYNTEAERVSYTLASAVSPVTRAFNGPVTGVGIGSIVLAETFTFFTIFVALMSTLLVIRHTRAPEEEGLMELVDSTTIGRYTPLLASLIVAVFANVILGATIASSYLAGGLELEGSALAGCATALVGITFATIAAVAAQLTRSARGANGIAAAGIGVAFLIRAIADMQGRVRANGVDVVSSDLGWLSPMGIARSTRPFADNEWGILLILGFIATGFTATAFWLQGKRDYGGAFLPERRGPARAHSTLLSELGLAWRLQRGLLLGWAVGLTVLAAAFGGVSKEVEAFANNTPEISQIIASLGSTRELVEAYMSFSLQFLAIGIAGYVIQALLRVRAEEKTHHLEILLASSVSRRRWVMSHAICVLFGAAALLAISGGAAGLAYGFTIGDTWTQTGRLVLASIVYLPAVMLFGGVVLTWFGLRAQWAGMMSWLLFAGSFLILQFAEILDWPDWVKDLSPFTHAPAILIETQVSFTPLLVIMLLTGGLMISGVGLFRRRDLS